LPLSQEEIRFAGHAIEVRLCAEDPALDFLPQAGRLALWRPAASVRIEHALDSGSEVSPHYDSMIAKLIAHGKTRDEAREKLALALDATVALGLPTNKSFLAAALRDETFARGGATTDFLAQRRFEQPAPSDTDYAIAAALLAASAGFGDWQSWSNSPARAMHLRLDERDIALQFERGVYRTGVELRVLAIDADEARIELEGTEERVHFAIADGVLYLARGGLSFNFPDNSHAPGARRGAGLGDGRLVAPMNGRVAAVHARTGETIATGQALVVLEAMKMEHGLSLPAPVRVKAVHVTAGAQVSPGQLLVEFEPA